MGNIEEELKEIQKQNLKVLSLKEIDKRIRKAQKQKSQALAVIKPKPEIIDALTNRMKTVTNRKEIERIKNQLNIEEQVLSKYGKKYQQASQYLEHYCQLQKQKKR